MDFVQPRMITSPYSGQPVKPKLVKKVMGDKIHIEAYWYCPTTGQFITKGIVKVEPKQAPGEEPKQ